MLRLLLEQGFPPGLLVEETSPVAGEERDKFLARIAGQPAPPAFADLAMGSAIPRLEVPNHNSPACNYGHFPDCAHEAAKPRQDRL